MASRPVHRRYAGDWCDETPHHAWTALLVEENGGYIDVSPLCQFTSLDVFNVSSTFPAYSVKNQACISARCAPHTARARCSVSWHRQATGPPSRAPINDGPLNCRPYLVVKTTVRRVARRKFECLPITELRFNWQAEITGILLLVSVLAILVLTVSRWSWGVFWTSRSRLDTVITTSRSFLHVATLTSWYCLYLVCFWTMFCLILKLKTWMSWMWLKNWYASVSALVSTDNVLNWRHDY